MRALVVALVAVAACYGGKAPTCTISCNADGECPGGLVCSPQGLCASSVQDCPISCEPRSYLRCNGSPSAQICGADRSSAETITCGAGCVADESGPHCRHIVPRFAPAICDRFAETDTATFGASDSIAEDSCLDQVAQPTLAICVKHARTLSVNGPPITGSAPIAFVADGDLTVTALDVSASGPFGGPGEPADESGDAPRTTAGGGGAGYATKGGDGGGGPNAHFGGSAIDPATASTFLGGSRAVEVGLVFGGGGGGGVMLVSCQGRVTIDGTVYANGGGGEGGATLAGVSTSGGGGGAGGHILVQAVDVMITSLSQIYANGGGGGGGLGSGVSHPGEDGSRTALAGAPGGLGGTGAGEGGTGGYRDHPPGAGGGDIISGAAGSYGGGGGAAGIFEIAMPAGAMPAIGATPNISPAPTTSQAIPLQ
jgi:hypothetical protein